MVSALAGTVTATEIGKFELGIGVRLICCAWAAVDNNRLANSTFAVVFMATVFAAGLLSWLIKKLVETVGLRPVDRTLGGVFGLARGLVLLP